MKHEILNNQETTQLGTGAFTCRKIQELNTKNESKTEYSLGDVMLLDKWEKQLEALNYTRTEIEALSPSFYGR